MSIYLYIYIYPSISAYISLSIFLYLTFYISIYLSVCLSIHPSIHPSIHVYTCINGTDIMCVCVCVCSFTYLLIYLFFIYTCVCVCVCVCVCKTHTVYLLFVWLFLILVDGDAFEYTSQPRLRMGFPQNPMDGHDVSQLKKKKNINWVYTPFSGTSRYVQLFLSSGWFLRPIYIESISHLWIEHHPNIVSPAIRDGFFRSWGWSKNG